MVSCRVFSTRFSTHTHNHDTRGNIQTKLCSSRGYDDARGECVRSEGGGAGEGETGTGSGR